MRSRPAAKNISEVVDLYLADLSRLAKPRSVDKYGELLDKFVKYVGDKTPIDAVTYEMCVLFLNRWSGVSPRTGRPYAAATRAQHTSFLNKLFEFAYQHDYMETAMKKLVRPRLPKPEDRNVVIVSTGEVQKMFKACTSWGDEICLGILAYTGARRNAVSMLRWRDVDLVPDPPHGPHGWIKLQEKGGKHTEKPVPFFLRQILDRAPDHEADEYVVPNYRPEAVNRKERSNAIIYNRVKRVAGKAGVNAHVHSIRAAFAVFFLENTRGSIKSLQVWLGHENLETTRHYTRGLDRRQLLSEGLSTDWGVGFVDSVMEEVESALSEGVAHRPEERHPGNHRHGDRAGLADLSPSLSALSGEGSRKTRVLGSERAHQPSPESALAALHEGVMPVPDNPNIMRDAAEPTVTSGNPEPRLDTGPLAASSSAGQSEGQERLAARHMLPREPVKAHTGFEPVIRLQETVHAGSIEARHKLGHRTGHSLRV